MWPNRERLLVPAAASLACIALGATPAIAGTYGKLIARHSNSSHILEKKSPKRKRHFRDPVPISPHDAKRVRKLLGLGKGK